MKSEEWKTYRTRFLVNAKQLNSTLSFIDHLGRQHRGRKGDYLVESSDGVLSIAPRRIFEDVYVPMSLAKGQGGPESSTREPEMERLRFVPLEIEEVKIDKASFAREEVNQMCRERHEEAARVRPKLPQPCRERRASAHHLRLM